MAILSKNSAYVESFFYTPPVGSLSYFNGQSIRSTLCREIFHRDLCIKPQNEFFYTLKQKQTIEGIVKYIDKIEKKLKVENESEFFRTKYKDIIKIKPNWWKDNIRLELLTVYLKSIYGNALSNNKYTKPTKKAIKRFLDGNVYYDAPIFPGWVNAFSGNTNLDRLTKKKKENKVKFFHAYEINFNQE